MSKKKYPRVLIVDDDETNGVNEYIAQQYPHIMFYCHVTASGGLKRLHDMGYDFEAVILDLALPDQTGREMTHTIRKVEAEYGNKKPVKIYWYTGWPIDLENAADTHTQSYFACDVAKLFVKGDSTVDEVIEEVLGRLSVSSE